MAGDAAGLERAFLASLALHGAVLAGVSLPEFASHPEAAPAEPIAARLVEEEREKTAPVLAPSPLRKAARLASTAREKASTVESAPAPGAVPAPAPQPVQLAVAGTDPGSIRDYRALLLGAAARFKRYPQEARENNWTGDVVVGVAVGAGGAVDVGLRRGSGHAVLDAQALDMFRQAARAVPLPERLRGREFGLELRAVYGLED